MGAHIQPPFLLPPAFVGVWFSELSFSFCMINTLESYGWEGELRRGRENSSDKALATVSFSQKTRWNNVRLSGGAGLELYARIRTAIWVEELVTESSWGNAAAAACCGICCRLVLLVGDGAGCLNRSRLKICPFRRGCFADKGGGGDFCQLLAVAAECCLAGTSCFAECWLMPGATSTGMPGEVSVLFLLPRQLKGFVATQDRFKVYLKEWGYKLALTRFP